MPLKRISFRVPPRAVLACIQIPTDCVLDREGPALVSKLENVELRMQKMEFTSDAICAKTYFESASNLQRAAATLLPPHRCDVVGLACTSMSFTLGPERVDALLSSACPGAKTTDMARAQAAAIAALGASRIALLTPYIQELADANKVMLEETGGIKVVRRATMELDRDELTTAVDEDTIVRWASELISGERRDDNKAAPEALVIGCSAFRACEHGFISQLEEKLNLPVVTSTQAFLWSMLRIGGINDRIEGYGRLFEQC